MDKRKFIHKLNRILSEYQNLAIVNVSYGLGIIFIKFSIYNGKEFLSIQRDFVIKTFPTMSDEHVKRTLDKALKELWNTFNYQPTPNPTRT